MLAVAHNTPNYTIDSANGQIGTLAILRRDNGYIIKMRCLEYVHTYCLETNAPTVPNAMLLFKNCRALSFRNTGEFTLLELLVIARDLHGLEHFYKHNFFFAGENSLPYRKHIWDLATTTPRLLFKHRLPEPNKNVIQFLKNKVYAIWTPTSKANFKHWYVQKRKTLLNIFCQILPNELAIIVVGFIPHNY